MAHTAKVSPANNADRPEPKHVDFLSEPAHYETESTSETAALAGPVKQRPRFARRSTILFLLVMGTLLLVGGSVITWWGTRSPVQDLVLIGSLCVVIGFGFLLLGVVFLTLTYCPHGQLTRFDLFTIKKGKRSPDVAVEAPEVGAYPMYGADKLNEKRPPSGDVLYGERRAVSPTTVAAAGDTSDPEAPAPVIAFPSQVTGPAQAAPRPIYGVVMTAQKPPVGDTKSDTKSDIPRPVNATQSDSSEHNHKPKQDTSQTDSGQTDNPGKGDYSRPSTKSSKVRPDSGFTEDTPDTDRPDRPESALSRCEL